MDLRAKSGNKLTYFILEYNTILQSFTGGLVKIFIGDEQYLNEGEKKSLVWAIERGFNVKLSLYIPSAESIDDGAFLIFEEVKNEVV